MLLPVDFFRQPEVERVAKALLGKILCTRAAGQFTAGRITETEAYSMHDKACHAYGGRITARNAVMFGPGGRAYVYRCYGIHHLFNVVSNVTGVADAVLIRAIEPLEGIELMMLRRGHQVLTSKLSSGPGTLTVAMGIDQRHNQADLQGKEIWIEDAPELPGSQIEITTRIGVEYAGEDALLPRRFYDRLSPFVSHPIKGRISIK